MIDKITLQVTFPCSEAEWKFLASVQVLTSLNKETKNPLRDITDDSVQIPPTLYQELSSSDQKKFDQSSLDEEQVLLENMTKETIQNGTTPLMNMIGMSATQKKLRKMRGLKPNGVASLAKQYLRQNGGQASEKDVIDFIAAERRDLKSTNTIQARLFAIVRGECLQAKIRKENDILILED